MSTDTTTTACAAVLDQARARPEAIAVVDGDGTCLTYRELGERAQGVCRRLRDRGVGPGHRVAVTAPRSADFVVAALGIMLAGAAYVPLDPDAPAARNDLITRDAAAAAVVGTRGQVSGGPGPGEIALDRRAPVASDPAYVIYTSGSTGQPKGVVIEHAQLQALLASTARAFSLGPEDTWSFFHSTAFDVSVWEVWSALSTGGRLVVVPTEARIDPLRFHDLLARQGVTVLSQTPTAFALLDAVVGTQAQRLDAIRLVVFAGELLRPGHVRGWADRYGCAALVNMYGITETTVHSTVHHVTADDLQRQSIPIGRPLDGWELLLVDESGAEVPVGVPGEILVGGAGVARGYLGRDALTRERFVEIELGGVRRRVYRSGDLALRHADGTLEHRGRLDDQVKLRGHRIELGEIEAHLRALDGVSQAVALLVTDPRGDAHTSIHAFACGNTAAPGERLRSALGETLPPYMVPAAVHVLATLPLSINGKVDRDALRRRVLAVPSAAAPDGASPVAAAWAEVVGRTPAAGESFFEVGGNSLLAVELATRLRERGLRADPADVYAHARLHELERLLLGEAATVEANGATTSAPAPARQGVRRGVVMVPPAGAGGSFFHGWAAAMQPVGDVLAVTLPGREDRMREPPPETIPEGAADVVAQAESCFGPDAELVFAGHSFGGTVAYEAARLWHARGRRVRLVVLAGVPAPHVAWDSRESELDDDELVAAVAARTGADQTALAHPDLRDLILPALRADIAAEERYRPCTRPAVGAPLLVVRGDADRSVSADEVAAWAVHTDALHEASVAGGHMAPIEDPTWLSQRIAAALDQLERAPSA